MRLLILSAHWILHLISDAALYHRACMCLCSCMCVCVCVCARMHLCVYACANVMVRCQVIPFHGNISSLLCVFLCSIYTCVVDKVDHKANTLILSLTGSLRLWHACREERDLCCWKLEEAGSRHGRGQLLHPEILHESWL